MFVRLLSALIREMCITAWALQAIWVYDAFIFGFGETLLRGNIDLLILRLLRKPVVVNLAHGSEGRPPYLDGSALLENESPTVEAHRLSAMTRKVARRVRRLERWATYVIGAPFSNSHFLKNEFVNHFAVGIPYSPPAKSGTESEDTRASNSVVILHCPSNPRIKGSTYIERIVRELMDEGFEIDFRVIVGRPNTEVISALNSCDFVIDQIFSDTPLAGFATEAAWMGRCSIVGGYKLDSLRAFIPAGMDPPSVTCVPSDLKATIVGLLEHPETVSLVADQAREFVQDHWNSAAVAARYIRILGQDIPVQWMTDPFSVVYIHGMGMSEDQVRGTVTNLIAECGIEALELSHRPDLLNALLTQIKSDGSK